jgi:membrane protein implicated in regulation of membrane protease activity
MPESDPLPEKQPSWPGASLALFILGLLILVPSGLCTAFAIAAYPLGVLFFLMFGALPMAMGGLLIWGALKARGPK